MIVKEFFIKGLLIGLSVAVAVGPIALLCIQRTLSHGFKVGFSTGLGAAVADATYGLIAGIGLTMVSDFLIMYEGVIAGIGSLFLCWLGMSTFKTLPIELAGHKTGSISLPHSFFSSFFLTMSSPMTILLFTAVFAGLGFVRAPEYDFAFSLVSGVFLGSTIWWLILSGTIKLIRGKLSQKSIVMINRASGIMLLIFACYAFVKAGIHLTMP